MKLVALTAPPPDGIRHRGNVMFNKTRAIAQKFGTAIKDNQAKAYVGTMLLLSAAASQAQEVDPFTDALNAMKLKVATYGGSLVGLAAVGVAFFVAMKYVKKIPRAA